jgi:hypothetical protein
MDWSTAFWILASSFSPAIPREVAGYHAGKKRGIAIYYHVPHSETHAAAGYRVPLEHVFLDGRDTYDDTEFPRQELPPSRSADSPSGSRTAAWTVNGLSLYPVEKLIIDLPESRMDAKTPIL